MVYSMLGFSVATIGGTYVSHRPDLDSSLPEHSIIGALMMFIPEPALQGLGFGMLVHDLPDTITNPSSLMS